MHEATDVSNVRNETTEETFIMFNIRPATLRLSIAALAVFAATAASAVPVTTPLYPNRGTQNADTYNFTAAKTGDITAWFAGSTAGYTENLGLMINGVATGIIGLGNKTSAVGDKLVLGHAKAGDNLVFFINIVSPKNSYFSDKSLNVDSVNHVWSTSFSGNSLIPAGTYVAFEDMRGGGDLNYHDETFVFSNVMTNAAVPEPAAWALLVAGFGMVGGSMRRRRGSLIAVAA
jgi:hypothetical protein